MPSAEAELKLIECLRAGDPAALEALIELYAARIFRLAHGITRNDADAEEVVQDVFLTLSRKIDTFEGRAALWSWIFRIATNAALVKRRSKRFEVEVPLEDLLPTFHPDGHHEGDPTLLLADWSQTPEEELLSSETRAMVWRAIDTLPDDYRIVLVLRDVEGFTNEEAAGALNETVACIKSRLHRARMAVREQLTRHLGARATRGPATRGPAR